MELALKSVHYIFRCHDGYWDHHIWCEGQQGLADWTAVGSNVTGTVRLVLLGCQWGRSHGPSHICHLLLYGQKTPLVTFSYNKPSICSYFIPWTNHVIRVFSLLASGTQGRLLRHWMVRKSRFPFELTYGLWEHQHKTWLGNNYCVLNVRPFHLLE